MLCRWRVRRSTAVDTEKRRWDKNNRAKTLSRADRIIHCGRRRRWRPPPPRSRPHHYVSRQQQQQRAGGRARQVRVQEMLRRCERSERGQTSCRADGLTDKRRKRREAGSGRRYWTSDEQRPVRLGPAKPADRSSCMFNAFRTNVTPRSLTYCTNLSDNNSKIRRRLLLAVSIRTAAGGASCVAN